MIKSMWATLLDCSFFNNQFCEYRWGFFQDLIWMSYSIYYYFMNESPAPSFTLVYHFSKQERFLIDCINYSSNHRNRVEKLAHPKIAASSKPKKRVNFHNMISFSDQKLLRFLMKKKKNLAHQNQSLWYIEDWESAAIIKYVQIKGSQVIQSWRVLTNGP